MDGHLIARQMVIVGGVFAGLGAALQLGHRPVEITVVDRAAHHVFQPLLFQRATEMLSERRITVPLRDLFRRQDDVDRCWPRCPTSTSTPERCGWCAPPAAGSTSRTTTPTSPPRSSSRISATHESAPHARGRKTLTDALVLRRRRTTRGELLDSAMVPAVRVSTERPDRLGLG
jgi:NADH dehydrogenase